MSSVRSAIAPSSTVPAGDRWRAVVDRLAERVQAWSDKRKRLAACAAGAASVLAMPPFHCWPVLWLTLPMLCLTVDAAARLPSANTSRFAPWRRWPVGCAAEMGWWFGFGYHVAGLFWIGEAFLVEAEVFAWLLPFAVTLLPAGLAMFTALAAASMHAIPGLTAIERVAALAIGFGVTEWLRGHILTGFPWNVLGYALTWPLPLMQSASVFGIYGLTVITVAVFAGPFALLRGDARRPHLLFAALAAGLIPLALMGLAGSWRLSTAPITSTDGRPKIRLIQPSIPQRERLQAENVRRIFDQHLALSLTAPDGHIDNADGVDVIVWPEAAMPFVPLSQPVALDAIGTMLPPGSRLAAGALRLETDPATGGRKVFNSLLVFERNDGGVAQLTTSYDKLHLVPFGEYLPVQGLLETIGLQQLTRMRGGFAAGAGPRTLIELPGLGRVLPLICYEAIFPLAPQPANQRPDLVLTITNDGWFGVLTGPRQHYHQARVRAVELGVPLLRSSSNGISALIDGHGVELGRLELNAVGTLDVRPPAALAPAIYAHIGDKLFLTMIGVLLTWLVRRAWHRHKTQRRLTE